MIVLVADVPASYGMLLGHNFGKDVGGELNMDMSEARILVKGVMQKLLPERETKYRVIKSEDPHAQILFESIGMGNYYLHAIEISEFAEDYHSDDSITSCVLDSDRFADASEEMCVSLPIAPSTMGEKVMLFAMEDEDVASASQPSDEVVDLNDVWILEFDGGCVSSSIGAGVVLISTEGEMFPYSYKLQFDNTNNTAEYEALILGINPAQIKGIRNLHARGDAKLVVCQI